MTGVIAGIGDAASQGLAVGLGAQQKFSAVEMLESVITAGVLSGAGGITEKLLKVDVASTATQLVEMKAGLRDKFDANAVALQVSWAYWTWESIGLKDKFDVRSVAFQVSTSIANSLVSAKMSDQMQGNVAPRVANVARRTVVNAVMGSGVRGAPLNVRSMAADAVGAVGEEVGGLVGEKTAARLNAKELDEEIAQSEVLAKMNLPEAKLDTSSINANDIYNASADIKRELTNENTSAASNLSRQAEEAALRNRKAGTTTSRVLQAFGEGAVKGIANIPRNVINTASEFINHPLDLFNPAKRSAKVLESEAALFQQYSNSDVTSRAELLGEGWPCFLIRRNRQPTDSIGVVW